MVPKKGLEPPHPCEYMDLNHARLPIPPLRHGTRSSIALNRQQLQVSQIEKSVSNAAVSAQLNEMIRALKTSKRVAKQTEKYAPNRPGKRPKQGTKGRFTASKCSFLQKIRRRTTKRAAIDVHWNVRSCIKWLSSLRLPAFLLRNCDLFILGGMDFCGRIEFLPRFLLLAESAVGLPK